VKTQEFYLREKRRNFFMFYTIYSFANLEFIFATRDPKLARRGVEYTQDTAQNRGKFLFLPQENLHFHRAAGSTLCDGFSVLCTKKNDFHSDQHGVLGLKFSEEMMRLTPVTNQINETVE